jgi:hypothetical protein
MCNKSTRRKGINKIWITLSIAPFNRLCYSKIWILYCIFKLKWVSYDLLETKLVFLIFLEDICTGKITLETKLNG